MVPIVRLSNVLGHSAHRLIAPIACRDCRSHAQRRRRNREAFEDGQRVLRSVGRGGGMVESIIKDKKKILPCAALLEGEYGINGLFVGRAVKLGANGIEKIYEIKLSDEEKAALKKSAGAVQGIGRCPQTEASVVIHCDRAALGCRTARPGEPARHPGEAREQEIARRVRRLLRNKT